ncbi:hypothetical protein SARC_01652 [Sphaeroforma arctica JP610]|uniref:Uncharacterized protein n=1 Tax=Sphaeroforma arctica JP610 TaxID=667725 RepID=A0A0L0GB98_9EUKA|nr:hypothetical protein SARC_01652 [Sphaeroforma arctica JP610]KNC86174.1 hypothetical protein SARC_01652 [Sphaeroforma arctica JP610]|eukprot:XP_014160076.1 hypothetical protein SARC_01652 [Sphaeroforma arctica JP610]
MEGNNATALSSKNLDTSTDAQEATGILQNEATQVSADDTVGSIRDPEPATEPSPAADKAHAGSRAAEVTGGPTDCSDPQMQSQLIKELQKYITLNKVRLCLTDKLEHMKKTLRNPPPRHGCSGPRV